MTTLVTGSHGYVGSAVLGQLSQAEISFKTCDSAWFDEAYVGALPQASPHFDDFTSLTASDLEDIDAVIHLAAYSNDPTGSLSPEATMCLNYHATVSFAKAARAAGVRTFVFSSSCSVYGDSHVDLVDEDSEAHPLTPYAVSKKRSEEALLALQTPDFRVAILRGATAFGASDVPRTDLLLNDFCAQAALGKGLILNSLGTSWRPFMPIRDFARALVTASQSAPDIATIKPIWNIAPPDMQMTVRDATRRASDVAGISPPVPPKGAVADKRSYRVDGSRFLRAYPKFAFRCDFEEEIGRTIEAFAALPTIAADIARGRFVRLASLSEYGRLAS